MPATVACQDLTTSVFVGGRQVEDLDEAIDLSATAQVIFRVWSRWRAGSAAERASWVARHGTLRLERLMARDRRWPYGAWVHRYLRHPPTGLLTRRVLWQDEVGGTWMTGLPADPSGSPVPSASTVHRSRWGAIRGSATGTR